MTPRMLFVAYNHKEVASYFGGCIPPTVTIIQKPEQAEGWHGPLLVFWSSRAALLPNFGMIREAIFRCMGNVTHVYVRG